MQLCSSLSSTFTPLGHALHQWLESACVCVGREFVLCTAVFSQGPCTSVCCMVSKPSEDCEKHMCKELLKEKLSSVVSSYLSEKVKVKVTQSCLTLCNPMDQTVHGILQARKLEWGAFPFSRGSSQPRDRTQVSCITVVFFTS